MSGEILPSATPTQTLHATTVALHNRAVLIMGPAGSGKSGLALQLMAFGAALVADDRTVVWASDGALWAMAPPGLPPLIEARGIGLLRAPNLAPATRVSLVVDMGQTETRRLPPLQHYPVMGLSLPLVFHISAAHFPASVLHYLIHGRDA